MSVRLQTLFAAGFAAVLLLQEPAFAGAEPIVITATRTPTPLRELGSSVSVLTHDDFERNGNPFAIETLRTLPGIGISQNGGPGGLASIRIRGEEAYRTVVLIDGIRVSDVAGTQVATNLTSLQASDIDHIELVRGPQSLLYGADAVGGIVQIFTPDPGTGWSQAGEISAGFFGARSGTEFLSYGSDGVGAALQGSYYKNDGFSSKEGDPALADPDGVEAFALHGKLIASLGSALELKAVGRYASSDAEFDGASAFLPFFPADPNRLLKSRESAARISLGHRAFGGIVETELAGTYSGTQRTDLDNGLPFAFGSRFDGIRRRAELISTIHLGVHDSLLLGGDGERLSISTDTEHDRSAAYGAYLEWQGAFSGWLFTTIGLRFDHGDDISDHVSGRATLAALLGTIAGLETRIHTSYGSGFRAPSLFEQATNKAVALPHLNEENSRGVDGGMSAATNDGLFSFDVTYFDQTITNEIRFDNVGFTGYFQSGGVSHSRGVESSTHAEMPLNWGWISGFRVDAAYTYTDARVHSPDLEDGLQRVRRPRHMGSGSVSILFAKDRADLTVNVRTSADTQDGFREFRTRLDDYAVVDLSARYRIASRLEFFASGVNLTNEKYQEVSGFATSGAAIYAGLRLRR